MNIKVNNKDMELADGSSLQQVALILNLPEKGVAVAVNNQMIPRTDWQQRIIRQNDQIVVIKAACGG